MLPATLGWCVSHGVITKGGWKGWQGERCLRGRERSIRVGFLVVVAYWAVDLDWQDLRGAGRT